MCPGVAPVLGVLRPGVRAALLGHVLRRPSCLRGQSREPSSSNAAAAAQDRTSPAESVPRPYGSALGQPSARTGLTRRRSLPQSDGLRPVLVQSSAASLWAVCELAPALCPPPDPGRASRGALLRAATAPRVAR